MHTHALYISILFYNSYCFPTCTLNHKVNQPHGQQVSFQSHHKHQSKSQKPAHSGTRHVEESYQQAGPEAHFREDKTFRSPDIYDDHYVDMLDKVHASKGKAANTRSAQVTHGGHVDEHDVGEQSDNSDLFNEHHLVHEDIHDDYDFVHKVSKSPKTDRNGAESPDDDTDCCRCTCRRRQKNRKICWNDYDDEDYMP